MGLKTTRLRREQKRLEKTARVVDPQVQEDLDRISEGGYKVFVELSWPHIDNSPFVDNWHIDVLCEEMDRVLVKRMLLDTGLHDRIKSIPSLCRIADKYGWDGEKIEEVICVPPGSSKTTLVSKLFQPYVWTIWPEAQFITCTFEQSLALTHSGEAKAFVCDDWYQARWPIKLIKDAEYFWKNSKGGWRYACGTGSAVTGRHGHFHIYDDLIKEQDSRIGSLQVIAAAMEKASNFVFLTMTTREVLGGASKIMIGQRLHVNDPQGHAIKEGWKEIRIPALFDPDHADPLDRRTVRGEVLCEKVRTRETWAIWEHRLGPTAASAQISQRPIGRGGNVIKLEWLANRYTVLPGELRETMLSGIVGEGQSWLTAWDLAFDGTESSSWVVGQCWCYFRGKFYLIDQVRQHVSFEPGCAMLRDFAGAYPWVTEHYIEKAANASATESVLVSTIPGLFLASVAGGTLARTLAVEGYWKDTVLPFAPWTGGGDGYVAELASFTGAKGECNDQVSAASLALLQYTQGEKNWWSLAMARLEREAANPGSYQAGATGDSRG